LPPHLIEYICKGDVMKYRWLFPIFICVGVLLCSSLLGGDVVVFTNGRWLEVKCCQFKGDQAILLLKSGGVIECSLRLIKELRWEKPASQYSKESPKDKLLPYILSTARRYKVDARLVNSICKVESNFDPQAVSSKGAMGLMQLMPETATRFGVQDPFNPQLNLEVGVRYLKYLLETFNGNVELALAAYNAGEGVVQRFGGVPPYPETINYIKRVMNAYLREP